MGAGCRPGGREHLRAAALEGGPRLNCLCRGALFGVAWVVYGVYRALQGVGLELVYGFRLGFAGDFQRAYV